MKSMHGGIGFAPFRSVRIGLLRVGVRVRGTGTGTGTGRGRSRGRARGRARARAKARAKARVRIGLRRGGPIEPASRRAWLGLGLGVRVRG